MNMIHVCLSDLNRDFLDKLKDDKTDCSSNRYI